jgi:hypothetical protein
MASSSSSNDNGMVLYDDKLYNDPMDGQKSYKEHKPVTGKEMPAKVDLMS